MTMTTKNSSSVTNTSCRTKWIGWTWSQICILALIGFGTRGMWSALNALGGAGTSEIKVATLVNTSFSAGYSLLGFLGGSVVNVMGPRMSILAGSMTIATLVTLFYLYAFHRAVPSSLVVSMAFIDGIGATFLWSAVSFVLLFYPRQSERGRAMTVFNLIYNCGAVTGALISFFMNSNNPTLQEGTSANMSSTSYLSIIVIMCSACLLSSLMRNPDDVHPQPFTTSQSQPQPTPPLQELHNLWKAATHKYTGYLFILFLTSTWHLVFVFNWMNAAYFNVRSRAANSAFYWVSRIAATIPLQLCLDSKRSSYWVRGLRGIILLGAVWCAATGCALYVSISPAYAGEGLTDTGRLRLDISDPQAFAPLLCFILYGALDTIGQSYAIWIVGALPIDSKEASRICGMYRSVQGLGQMLSWVLDIGHAVPYRFQFGIFSGLWLSGFAALFALVWRHLERKPECSTDLARMEPEPIHTSSTVTSFGDVLRTPQLMRSP